MTSKIFKSGTVIDSAWLNDVNATTYNIVPTILPNLASTTDATKGTYLIGHKSAQTNAIGSTLQKKVQELVSIEDFRISTDVVGSDTALVQRAFDSGKSIYFTQDYFVDSINASSIGQTIDFNGYKLIGTRAAAGGAQYVMAITGRQMKIYGLSINANFGGYTCCVRWFSVSNSAPAQYNNVYGLNMSYCGIGLIYGQEIGTISVDASQSENTIYGMTCRGIQTPFVGNQSNGFITLVSPILDCGPYEWSTQPGYNATTFNTAALTINNMVGQVVIVGGEVLKTSSQLGYGFRGKDLLFMGTVFEVACAQGYIIGDVQIRDSTNGYMAADSVSAFTIASEATGTLRLSNIKSYRGAGVGSYSGVNFINYESPTSMTDVVIEDGLIVEWKVSKLVGPTVYFNNVKVMEATGSTALMLNDNNNCLAREKGIDTSIYTTTSWNYVLYSGAGSSMAIGTTAPTGKNAASLELIATGTAAATSADLTNATTIKSSSIRVVPLDYFRLETWAKATSSQCQINVLYYNLAGELLTPLAAITGLTTTWTKYKAFSQAPPNAAYMVIQVYGQTGTINVTDLVLTRFMKST
jgi:hypothetical protein